MQPLTTTIDIDLEKILTSETATPLQRVFAAMALADSDSEEVVNTLRKILSSLSSRPKDDESLVTLFLSIISFCRIITTKPKVNVPPEYIVETLLLCLAQYNFIFDQYTSDDGLIIIRSWPSVFIAEDPLLKIANQENGLPDLLTNILFIRATAQLIKAGGIHKLNIAPLIEGNELMIYCFNEKYWNENTGNYQRDSWLTASSEPFFHLSGLLPLYAKIPTQEKAEAMLKHLLHPRYLENDGMPAYLCATWIKPNQPQMTGPIQPLLNWLLAIGLRNYDFVVTADQVKSETLALIRQHGYCAAFTNTGDRWPDENNEPSVETASVEILFAQYIRH